MPGRGGEGTAPHFYFFVPISFLCVCGGGGHVQGLLGWGDSDFLLMTIDSLL